MFKNSKRILTAVCVAAVAALSGTAAQAVVTYSTWSSNEAPNGNYILTIADTGTEFNWHLTVSPWNAEALGLFVDFGAVTMPATVSLTNVSPAGEVALVGKDTTSDVCGNGCNLGGLPVTPVGGDWELVFGLGEQGWDNIQTFSWTTSDFGLSESSFGLVAIRAQQLCEDSDETLPGDIETCEGSDKVYGYGTTSTNGGPPSAGQAPEPGTSALALLALGMLGLGFRARSKARAS